MELDDFHVFSCGPLVLVDVRTEMVMPTFPTLLADSAWQGQSNVGPIFCAVLSNIFCQFFVFLGSPRTLYHVWV